MCKWTRGSYTIEAAILIPFLIFIMVGSIRAAIDLYEEIKTDTDVREERLWMVDEFYLEQGVQEVVGDGS